MPYNPSQDIQTLSGRVRNFANMHKPIIDIRLDTTDSSVVHKTNFIHSFSTHDKIEGTAYFTAPHDAPFDDIEISFTGTVKTYVDKVGAVSAVNSRSEAFHQFLKLTQPIDTSRFPEPRVAKAGQTYKIPFTFVVPDQRLPSSCRHKHNNYKIQDAHLQLPPSLGDPELAGTGTTLLSDMTPEMVRISYAVKVRMIRNRFRDGKETVVAERTQKVRIIPATYEQPPVDVDGMDEEYQLRKDKSLRKGIFKGKIGRIVAEAAQPRSLHLSPPDSSDPGAPTTMATVMLRFDPADANASPPRLGSMSSKLKVATYFSSGPLRDFPSKARLVYETTSGIHIDSLTLSSRCVSQAQWQRHEPGTSPADVTIRRDSAVSVSSAGASCPQPTKIYSPDKPFYTAQILVPVALPANKSYVPTFHSCLVSRIYILDLNLSIPSQSGGAGVPTSLGLSVPMQISSESNQTGRGSISADPDELAAMDHQHLDEYFMPRSIAPPPAHFLERSQIGLETSQAATNNDSNAPPEYSYFAPAGGVVPVCG